MSPTTARLVSGAGVDIDVSVLLIKCIAHNVDRKTMLWS